LAGIQADFARSGKVLCEGTGGGIAGGFANACHIQSSAVAATAIFIALRWDRGAGLFEPARTEFAWHIQILAYKAGCDFFSHSRLTTARHAVIFPPHSREE
jgi:hypothetical protein